jgi:hypothetical protein
MVETRTFTMGRIVPDTQCFEDGVQARASGLKRADNPYDIETPEHAEWAAGWAARYDLDEDSDPASDRDQPVDDLDPPDTKPVSGP